MTYIEVKLLFGSMVSDRVNKVIERQIDGKYIIKTIKHNNN